MRTSKREQILAVAVGLIEERGVEAVTFENLADASGLSKSGLIYHFPSRHELLLGIHTHMAEAWEEELIEAAGGPAEDVSKAARLRAVVVTMGSNAPRAELLMALDAGTHPDFSAPWTRVDQAWLPTPEQAMDSPQAQAAYLVLLMADGLWMHDHLHGRHLPEQVRAALIESVLAQIP
ncbi:TetR/AcrR family transcriptional regulator [Citricoccus sp.]|uniref:TetR/AcrR family transcriptional regulator n=1 Tax=Citricoccus sp. TaxID=1978372 RepID=UPI0028BD8169|nr:TetR/AcrR family transcriptional regulator [Citricoccus sp.]